MSDRRVRVRWNSTISDCRVFSAGVLQGSLLSPLLFDIFVSMLPEAIRNASPSVQVVQSADDVTLVARAVDPFKAAIPMQAALDGLSSWARDHAIKIATEKIEAPVITTDRGQVNDKCQPGLWLNGTPLLYNARPKVLGVILDSQMRFGTHAQHATAKLAARINIVKALSGTSWGADERTLRELYVSYARPTALYA